MGLVVGHMQDRQVTRLSISRNAVAVWVTSISLIGSH
jgi:hypothetical protein